MTLKTQKFRKKSDIFCRKSLEKYFDLFSKKISATMFRFWSKKNGWFYKILEKLKKEICQNRKFGSVTPVKRLSFLLFFVFFVALASILTYI